MSYSSLATKCTLSPNFVERTRTIDSVSIHCACSNIKVSTMGELYKDKSRQASANYGIGNGGDIGCFVDETNASMCTSNTTIDDRSISIMVASTSSSSPYSISTSARNALVNLLVDICMRNNIPDLRWENSSSLGQQAAKGGSVADQNVFIHTWFRSGVIDPGEWMISNLKSIVTEVNKELESSRKSKRRIVFIGDDRAKRMHSAVGTDANLWLVDYKHASDWLLSGATGVYKIEESFNIRSAVCFVGGLTDIGYINPRSYAQKINEYAARWLLRGIPVYYVSITQVDEESGYHGITNGTISSYNSSMQASLRDGVGYIDAYSAIEEDYVVSGGDSYDNSTYKSIYGTIVSYARRMTGTISFDSELELDPTQFDPFIALFGRNAKVDYHALKNLRVLGAIIEGGYRYNQDHTRTKVFDNPNIEDQITALDNNKIWYGMYTICRARTVIEAKIEVEYFRYQLYRHPPRLGAWLNIGEFGKDLSLNDSLLRQYNTDLTNLGFTGRMGIIATRNVLNYISWSVWQNEFFLYLVDHVGDLAALNDFLTPWFFSIDAAEIQAGEAAYVYTPTVVSDTSTSTESGSVIISGQSVKLSESDIKLIGAVVYSEAGGESYDAQLAVANVILNRIKSKYYPDTVSGVIYQELQFTGTKTANFRNNMTTGGSATSLKAARDAVAGKNNVKDCMGFKFPRAVDLSKTTYHIQYGKIMFFAWLKDPGFK